MVGLNGGSNPHPHQFMNFKGVSDEAFDLDASNSGEIRGTMDLGLNNNIVHRSVITNITIDRGVLLSVTPNVQDDGIQPTIYGILESGG